MAVHNETGKRGEEIAIAFLEERGYTIIATNWRYKRCELDIISYIGDKVYFTEVKTRTNERYGKPEEGVDEKKMERIKKAAGAFLVQNPIWKKVQFDVISIMLQNEMVKEIFFIEDVFL